MPGYKKDFPLLKGNDLVYLDNAATAQRPMQVLLAEQEFYEKYNANPLRGLYALGLAATEQYELAREKVRGFIHAKSEKENYFYKKYDGEHQSRSIQLWTFPFKTGG